MGMQIRKIGAGVPKTADKKYIKAEEKEIQIFSESNLQSSMDALAKRYKDKFDENYEDKFYQLAEGYKKRKSARNPKEAAHHETSKAPAVQNGASKADKPADRDIQASYQLLQARYKDKIPAQTSKNNFTALTAPFNDKTKAQNHIKPPKQKNLKQQKQLHETAQKKYVKPAEIDYSAEFARLLGKYQDEIEIVQGSDSIMPEGMRETILYNRISAENELKKRDEDVSLKKAETVKPAGKPQAPVSIDSNTAQKLDKRLGAGFTAKLEQVSKSIKCSPMDLLAVLCVESTLKPNAKNGSFYGLMQINEKRLKRYGTSGDALLKMNGVQQLDYIEKYFLETNPSHKYLDLGSLYAKVFLPNRSDRSILTLKGEAYYNPNRGLDTNKDGKIEKAEAAQHARNKLRSTLASLK